MTRRVLYLSFYRPEEGFLFPDELPDQYYSPGLFLVEEEGHGRLSSSYLFDAMDGGRRVTLQMTRHDEGNQLSNLYVVRTDLFGTFGFSLTGINPKLAKYRGGRPQLQNHNRLRIAVTQNSRKLERICEEFDFYFIGATLREESG